MNTMCFFEGCTRISGHDGACDPRGEKPARRELRAVDKTPDRYAFADLSQSFNGSTLLSVYHATKDRERTTYAPHLEAILARQDDDAILTTYARTLDVIENTLTPLRWIANLLENETGRRLHERRDAREGVPATTPISIPHPLVDATLSAVLGPYDPDVDMLEEAARGLPADDAERLLKITPEYTVPAQVIPARVVPRSVSAGNTATILSIARRYAGSAVGRMIEAAMKRPNNGDRVTIKPIAGAKA